MIEAAGIQPWIELPVWVPPVGEDAAIHDGDVSAIFAAGLTCRPVTETVADTWRWLQDEGDPPVREGASASNSLSASASWPALPDGGLPHRPRGSAAWSGGEFAGCGSARRYPCATSRRRFVD